MESLHKKPTLKQLSDLSKLEYLIRNAHLFGKIVILVLIHYDNNKSIALSPLHWLTISMFNNLIILKFYFYVYK